MTTQKKEELREEVALFSVEFLSVEGIYYHIEKYLPTQGGAFWLLLLVSYGKK
jgi:hypothetical protein